MQGKSKASEKRRTHFSTLSLYIMLSGWAGLAIYVSMVFFILDANEGESFLQHFLSTEHDGMRFRALIFFTPFISTVIGFLVNEREKFFRSSLTSEARYHDLFENANDIIFVLGADTTILEANEKASALLGRKGEELKGVRLSDLIPPEEAGLLDHRTREERFVCKLLASSGQWLDMELTSSAIIEADQVAGYRVIARDITDFKSMQEELSRAYDELQMSLADRTGELTNAKKRLLFESYERHKAEETISELLMRRKFGKHVGPELPDVPSETES